MLIDTHCHLDLFDNFNEILSKSRLTVSKFILPTINSHSLSISEKISKDNDDVFLAVGIHPEETKKKGFDLCKEIEFYEKFLEENNKKIIGIGECGLDIDKDETNLNNQSLDNNIKLQLQLFKEHISWAQKYNKPLIIHNRRGNGYFEEILKGKSLRGVFHCYASNKKYVDKVIEMGFYFGLGGMITLDEGLQKIVKNIPIERIVLETDSPYLTPKQIRKKSPFPNIPANIKYVAQSLGDIKKLSIDEIEQITNNNVKKLFVI